MCLTRSNYILAFKSDKDEYLNQSSYLEIVQLVSGTKRYRLLNPIEKRWCGSGTQSKLGSEVSYLRMKVPSLSSDIRLQLDLLIQSKSV